MAQGAMLLRFFYPTTQTAVGHSLWRRAKTTDVSPGMNARAGPSDLRRP